MEDDCDPIAGAFSPTAALAAVENASPAVAWLAWSRVGGVPRYGAHLLGFTRASLETAVTDLMLRRERGGLSTHPRRGPGYMSDGHCLGMDTWIYQMSQAYPAGAVPHNPSMARQVRHRLRGRQ